MPSLQKPSPHEIGRFLESQRRLEFTYSFVGATASKAPVDYRVDHTRVRLGAGEVVFDKARSALERWEQFRLGWLEAQPATTPILPGESVAVLARAGGLWWLNACRIVYVVDETTPIHRFGFAYGALPGHVGAGEERFLIEWDPKDDVVWYDILAYSRLRHPLARLGYPFARLTQKRFGRQSAAAMLRAVGESP